jgi:hypothetical protein
MLDILQAGIYVDKEFLQEQDQRAQKDLQDADANFRSWLQHYAHIVGKGAEEYGLKPQDIPNLVNLSSSAQILTLFFGGFQSRKMVKKKLLKAERENGTEAKPAKPQVEVVCCLATLLSILSSVQLGMGLIIPTILCFVKISLLIVIHVGLVQLFEVSGDKWRYSAR